MAQGVGVWKFVTILLVGLVLEAVGVVFLSRGMKEVGEMGKIGVAEVVRVVKAGATHPKILIGVALEAAFFGILLYLLARADVSLVWPLTSLGFVLTTVAAKFYLGEQVGWVRWLGVGCIVLGAGLVSYSEQEKEREKAAHAGISPAEAVVGKTVAEPIDGR
ncbi:MAG: EamA family transporter [Verrucomicrobiales bacterium]|nr:EamA family transporter [Verrucomicrobiales bacterium]